MLFDLNHTLYIVIINGLFAACGLEPPNAMFLQGTALEGVPFFNGYSIALLMVLLIFLFTFLWEFAAYKKGERWYSLLKRKEFGKLLTGSCGEGSL